MIASLVHPVVYLIILGLIIWLLVGHREEPVSRVARLVMLVIGALVVGLLLLNVVGMLPA